MCKRMIDACVMCRNINAHLSMCGLYDSNKLPNAWLTEHAKKNKNNVKNTIKFMFCIQCKDKNTITDQPELDIHYKPVMDSIKSTVRVSYVGVVEVRNRFNGGIIFLDTQMESIMHKRLSLNAVDTKITNKPVVVVGTMIPKVQLKRVHKDSVTDIDIEEVMKSIENKPLTDKEVEEVINSEPVITKPAVSEIEEKPEVTASPEPIVESSSESESEVESEDDDDDDDDVETKKMEEKMSSTKGTATDQKIDEESSSSEESADEEDDDDSDDDDDDGDKTAAGTTTTTKDADTTSDMTMPEKETKEETDSSSSESSSESEDEKPAPVRRQPAARGRGQALARGGARGALGAAGRPPVQGRPQASADQQARARAQQRLQARGRGRA